MEKRSGWQNVLWGGLLIYFGLVGLAELYFTLNEWAWAGILTLAGFFPLLVFLGDRSQVILLLPSYIFWAVAGLIALIAAGVLRDPWVVLYVFAAIALPFILVYARDRTQWWPLIPAYVMLVVGSMVALSDVGVLRDAYVATYILSAIALPFLLVFLRDREQWWALVPAYVLIAVGAMVALIETGLLRDWVIPAYVMFTIAVPFFVAYAWDAENRWALIPGSILALVGASMLLASPLAKIIGPALLIVAGLWILLGRVGFRRSGGA